MSDRLHIIDDQELSMIHDHIALLEMGITLGGVLLFLAYQYGATCRSIRRDKDKRGPR